MSNSNPALSLTLYTNFSQLELTEPKSAKIESRRSLGNLLTKLALLSYPRQSLEAILEVSPCYASSFRFSALKSITHTGDKSNTFLVGLGSIIQVELFTFLYKTGL